MPVHLNITWLFLSDYHNDYNWTSVDNLRTFDWLARYFIEQHVK